MNNDFRTFLREVISAFVGAFLALAMFALISVNYIDKAVSDKLESIQETAQTIQDTISVVVDGSKQVGDAVSDGVKKVDDAIVNSNIFRRMTAPTEGETK